MTTQPADWLTSIGGTLPQLALGYRYEVQLGKMLDEKQVTGDHLRPYLRNVDVQWGSINTDSLPQMDFDVDDRLKFSLRSGDILVCEGGEVGRAAVWQSAPGLEDVYFQKALHRLRPLRPEDEHPKYLYWCLHAAADQNAYADGGKSTIAHLPADAFRRVRFPKPARDAQERIANFLDDKTVRIDALIAEKESLQAALVEWRAAELTRVCFGAATATDLTGNPWVPMIPKSWRLARLKHVVTGIEQGWSPECEARLAADDEWGVLKAGASNGGVFRETEHKALPATLEPVPELEVQAGDVIVSRASGSADLVGSFAYVEAVRPRLMLSDKNFRLKFTSTPPLLPELLAWVCNTPALREQVRQYVSGADGLAKNIGSGNLRELWLPVPPAAVQPGLLNELRLVKQKLDALQGHLRGHLERLREYRSSLISAAVTGQLQMNGEIH